MDSPEAGGVADTVGQAVVGGFVHPFIQLALALLAIGIAAPALASMVLLWASPRWPVLERAMWINALAAVGLTFACGWVFGTIIAVGSAIAGDLDIYYSALPYVGGAVALLALWLQVRARAAFNWPRAVGLAAAAMVPVTVVLIDVLAGR